MDKIKHIGISLVLTLWLLVIGCHWIPTVIVVLLIGTAREYIDYKYGCGVGSWWDIVADCVGILIGVLTYIIIV